MAEGNTVDSRVIVNAIGQLPDAGSQNYASLRIVQLDLADSSQSVFDMSSVQEQTIRNVAASGTIIAAEAEAILSATLGEEYIHPIVKIQNQQLKTSVSGSGKESGKTVINDTVAVEEVEPYRLDNYPNPFSEGTIIRAYVPSGFGSSELVIRDIVGKSVLRYALKPGYNFIDIHPGEIGYGTYFYTLGADGRRLETKRMVSIR